jgi:hypothetical protein
MLDEQDKAKDKLIGKTIASVVTNWGGVMLINFTDGTACEFLCDYGNDVILKWEKE